MEKEVINRGKVYKHIPDKGFNSKIKKKPQNGIV